MYRHHKKDTIMIYLSTEYLYAWLAIRVDQDHSYGSLLDTLNKVAQSRGPGRLGPHQNEVKIWPINDNRIQNYSRISLLHKLWTQNRLRQTLWRRTTVLSVIASLGTKNYSIQKWGEVKLLPQNAPETVWWPGIARTCWGSLQCSLIPSSWI